MKGSTMKNISNLPKFMSVSFGLPDKLHELNRNMIMRDRMDGISVEYIEGEGIVLNRKTGEQLAKYVFVSQSANGKIDKFKMVTIK